MNPKQLALYALLLSLSFASCKKDEADKPEPPDVCTQITATWTADVKNIIETKCAISNCHVAGNPVGAPVFADYNSIKAKVDDGTFENRVLLNRNMPPVTQPPLDSATLDNLQCWFNAGALEN